MGLVQTLIRKWGIDVDGCDNLGNTALVYAAVLGKAEVALSLISEFGCDPNVRGRFGRSVLHNAWGRWTKLTWKNTSGT